MAEACAFPGGKERLIRLAGLKPHLVRRIQASLEAGYPDVDTWALPGRVEADPCATHDLPATKAMHTGTWVQAPEFRMPAPGARTTVTAESPGRYHPVDGDDVRSELGRGGIGRVLAVKDQHLGRDVALKELLDPAGSVAASRSQAGAVHLTGTSSAGMRFLREARVTGQLEHPNIVPIYELGFREDGTLYYTMKLVRGRTLAEVMAKARTLDERLHLLGRFQDLCNAIAYAHSRGVIHRDIKAENVMVGEFGETLVLDWGLAKLRGAVEDRGEDGTAELEGSPLLTLDGSLLGTPHHMSPEQASGATDLVDERTDVWALGTVLYELLTGRRAFPGASTWDVLEDIRTKPVAPPRNLDPRVPRELESICLKALQRDPAARYPDARELAQEIENYLGGLQVSAHEYTSWEHLRRFAAKNRATFMSAAAVLAVILAALGVLSASWARERREKLTAEFNLAVGYGERAASLLASRAYLESRIFAAAALLHNPAHPGSPIHAGAAVARHPDGFRQALLAESAAFRAAEAAPFAFRREFRDEAIVMALAYSPDGRLLAGGGADREIRLWDAATGALQRRLAGHDAALCALAFHRGGRLLASTDTAGGIRLWELPAGKPLHAWKGPGGEILGLAFSRDGSLLYTGGSDGAVVVRDLRDGAIRQTLKAHDAPVQDLAVSADGRLLATVSRDRTARVFELPSGRPLHVLRGHTGVVRAVAFAPDGTALATASYDRTLAVWNLSDGNRRFTATFDDEVMDVGWDPGGRFAAGLCWDHTLRFFDARSGELAGRVEAHMAPGRALAFSPRRGELATAGQDRAVRTWSMRPGEASCWTPGQGYLWCTRTLPGGRIVAAGADGAVRIYDARGNLQHSLSGHQDITYDLLPAPDGRTLFSCGYDRLLRSWDLDTGLVRAEWKGHEGPVRTLALSSDGRTLASGGKDNLVILWDVPSSTLRARLEGHEGPIRRVAISPDGRLVASTGEDGTLRLWDALTGAPRGILLRRGGLLGGLAFLGRGERLAVGTDDGAILLLDVATGRIQKTLAWHRQAVFALGVSRDGQHMLSAGDDRDVVLWDLDQAVPRIVFRAGQSVVAVDFSADGHQVVFGDAKVARVVILPASGRDLDPAAMLASAQEAAGMRLEGWGLTR